MTGYGIAEDVYRGKRVALEIKSVNSRYSDISIRIPRLYAFLEAPLKKAVGKYTSRGKIDIFVNIDSAQDETKTVEVNAGLAAAYKTAIEEVASATETKPDVTAALLAKLPDVLTLNSETENAEDMTAFVLSLLDKAAVGYDKMRTDEGQNLKGNLSEHLTVIEQTVFKIEAHAPEIVSSYREKIKARMAEIMDSVPYDETRLLTEVALFSDKVNVDEELARLKSHISQMREMLEASEPIGRKMDFLIQEMNREINTTGSKCNDLTIARDVIDVKAEIEKLREQIQNIE